MKLSFRKKRISKSTKRRLSLLGIIFIVSFVIFTLLFNFEPDVFTGVNVKAATLPTISVESQGQLYGEFFGYKTDIDLGRARNGLIPLNSERKLTYRINTYGGDVHDVYYEISTGDGERSIVANPVTDLVQDGDYLQSTLALSNLIDEGVEYMMVIHLTSGEERLHYYMRIKYIEDGREKESLNFAKYFMSTALSDNFRELATYMEPTPSSVDNGLSYVNIHSSLNDVGWVGFDIKEVGDAAVQFSEIDDSYTALELKFVIIGDEISNPGTFLVKEYYRMRKGEERIYLLDFERVVTQLFTGDIPSFKDNKLILGQNGEDMEFVSSRTGTNVAFSWGGELFEYNAADNTLTRVFSFRTDEEYDWRALHDEYGIDIISIDENGNLYYAVYGYMNAGEHEGYCGVALYYYDIAEDISKEQVFFETNHSYSSLAAGFDGEIFLSSTGNLYVCIEKELIRVSLSSGEAEILLSEQYNTAYALSDERRYLAYSLQTGDKITVMDLFTDSSYDIEAPVGKKLKVSNFIGEDLLYGIIDENDYTEYNLENHIYPMEEVVIANITGSEPTTSKTYNKPGKYITGISKETDYMVYIELSTKYGDLFVADDRDSIQYTMANTEFMASLSHEYDEDKAYISVEFMGTEMPDRGSYVAVNGLEKSNLSYYTGVNINIPASTVSTCYYAYRGMTSITSGYFIPDIIKDGYKNAGYCVDNDGNYIWQYGRGTSKKNIDLSEYDKSDKQRIMLTGCSLEEMLTYVYRGNPVYINEGSGDEIVIVGYDADSINVAGELQSQFESLPIESASERFRKMGNRFSTYITYSY